MKKKNHYSTSDNSFRRIATAQIQLIRNNELEPIHLQLVHTNNEFDILVGPSFTSKDTSSGLIVHSEIAHGKNNWLNLFNAFTKLPNSHFFDITFTINANTYPMLVIPSHGDAFDLFIYITDEIKHYEQLHKILAISEEFLQFNGLSLDYQEIVDDFLCFCSGKYAVFNLFAPTGTTFTTKAISVDKKIEKKITELLGYNLIGREWPFDPVYLNRISQSMITHFTDLYDIIGYAIPKPIVKLIESLFNIGEIIVVKIMKSDKILGEFTVFMDKKTPFIEDDMALLYTKQVGLLLSRFSLETQINNEQIFLKTTLRSIADGVIATDIDGHILLANKAAQTLIGVTSDELLGKRIDDFYNTSDELTHAKIRNIIYEVLEQGVTCIGDNNILLTAQNGFIFPVEQTASPILNDQGDLVGVVIVFRDISDKKEKQNKINFLTFHDQLTGLYNRRFYEEEVSRLDHPRNLPLSIIIGDINGLKLINDSFGHMAGDQLIIKAAEVIKKSIRTPDIAARLGGDEFVILLPSTGQEQVETILERIHFFSSTIFVESTPLSISFGYGIKYSIDESIQDIIKIAEDFVYKHKLYVDDMIRHQNVDLIMNALYKKNERVHQHTLRVSELCEALGSALGYDLEHLKQLRLAGLFHDIGHIAIDLELLNKTGTLTPDEWNQIKRHSEIGYRILSSVNDLSEIALYILEHHEKIDGSGYPRMLKDNAISKQARIIALVESYDTMTHKKAYGKVLSKKDAIIEIKACSGTQFDPYIAQIFVEKVLNEVW